MAKLIWSDEALQCLNNIHDYIASDSPEAAIKTIEGIYRKSEMLQSYPNLGYIHQDEEEEETRVILYGHYRILYETDGEMVGILGVFHAAMNIDR